MSVKDAKPKRKVAVPLPEGCSWEAFTQQVVMGETESGEPAGVAGAQGEQERRWLPFRAWCKCRGWPY